MTSWRISIGSLEKGAVKRSTSRLYCGYCFCLLPKSNEAALEGEKLLKLAVADLNYRMLLSALVQPFDASGTSAKVAVIMPGSFTP